MSIYENKVGAAKVSIGCVLRPTGQHRNLKGTLPGKPMGHGMERHLHDL